MRSNFSCICYDGDTLGVNGTQDGIFEKTNQVGLASLLESHNSRALESKISLEVLGNFTNQTFSKFNFFQKFL